MLTAGLRLRAPVAAKTVCRIVHIESTAATPPRRDDGPPVTSCARYSTASQKLVRVCHKKPPPPAARLSSSQAPPPPPPPPPPQDPKSFPWSYVLGALAVTGSVGGIYYFQNLSGVSEEEEKKPQQKSATSRAIRRVPASTESLPDSVPYLLVGGGTASFAAFRAIKSNDPKAKILVISEEDTFPYMRPPLSKEIWRNTEMPDTDQLSFQQWNGNRRSIYYETEPFYADPTTVTSLENGGVGVARGYTVSRVDPAAHTVVVSAPGQPDKTIQYGKCLIATGVRPRNVPVLEAGGREVRERCVLLRTVRDAELLWRRLERARSVVVVGGGFLGSEIACALGNKMRGSGALVTQVYRERGNMAHVLPEYLAEWSTRRVRAEGVRVLPDTEIKSAYLRDGRVALELSNGDILEADVIVVGAGSSPNTALAADSRLETHPELGGLLVNAELAARTDLYAAGDVACFYDVQLGRRRVEHHDHAVVSGRLAGENMAGAAPPRHYHHQSMFWSDLGPDLGYEAIGIIDSSLPTVGVFAEATVEAEQQTSAAASEEQVAKNSLLEKTRPEEAGGAPKAPGGSLEPEERKYERGVVFYLQGRRVVGVLMWNLFNRMHIARQLLSQGEEYDDLNEVAKLFTMHKQ